MRRRVLGRSPARGGSARSPQGVLGRQRCPPQGTAWQAPPARPLPGAPPGRRRRGRCSWCCGAAGPGAVGRWRLLVWHCWPGEYQQVMGPPRTAQQQQAAGDPGRPQRLPEGRAPERAGQCQSGRQPLTAPTDDLLPVAAAARSQKSRPCWSQGLFESARQASKTESSQMERSS